MSSPINLINTALEYDFHAAEKRARALVDVAAGRVGNADCTIWFRHLDGPTEAVQRVERSIAEQFLKDLEAVPDGDLSGHPTLRALSRLRAHPSSRGPGSYQDHRITLPVECERVVVGLNLPWSFRSTVDDLTNGLRRIHARGPLPDDRWLHAFDDLIMHHEYGALEPSFSRADALAGDIWLLEIDPTSRMEDPCQIGMSLLGYVAPSSPLAAGHTIAACVDRPYRAPGEVMDCIEWSELYKGWRFERWVRGQPPLDDPRFELLKDQPSASSPGCPWPAVRGMRAAPTGAQLLQLARRFGFHSYPSRRALRERASAIADGPEWADAHLDLAWIDLGDARNAPAREHTQLVLDCADPARAPAPLKAWAALLHASALANDNLPFEEESVVDAIAVCDAEAQPNRVGFGCRLLSDRDLDLGLLTPDHPATLRALAEYERVDSMFGVPQMLHRLVEAALAAGDPRSASTYLDRAYVHLARRRTLEHSPKQRARWEALRARIAAATSPAEP